LKMECLFLKTERMLVHFMLKTKEICTEKLLFHKRRTEVEDNLQERTARELPGIASGSAFGHG